MKNIVVSVLGAIAAALLLGSFFVEGVPRDIMRLAGFALLIGYCICKAMKRGGDSSE